MNTRLWYFFQAAAQDSPATYGIAPELYSPGGWDLWWRSGIRGSPPGEVLSECGVPLIIQNWTGQVKGDKVPTQCLIDDMPATYLLEFASIMARYRGELVLHQGSPHNSIASVWSVFDLMKAYGIERALIERIFDGLNTTLCFDAFGEAVGKDMGKNIHAAHSAEQVGFRFGMEGGLPAYLASIVKPRFHLWQRSALINMVNNPKAREGIAPLADDCEHVVWIDDATLATPEEHVNAAGWLNEGGVVPEAGSIHSYAFDGFQQSAARPLSAAISVGMKAEQVREIWGGGK